MSESTVPIHVGLRAIHQLPYEGRAIAAMLLATYRCCLLVQRTGRPLHL